MRSPTPPTVFSAEWPADGASPVFSSPDRSLLLHGHFRFRWFISGNVDGSNGDRPNLLDAAILGHTIGNPDTSQLLLPRSAFGLIQPTDARGNLGFNTFRRGGIRNMNASLARSWPLRSEMNVAFRADSINLFNTPQFAEPGDDLSSPAFGKITNTLNDGRSFQFTLQLQF